MDAACACVRAQERELSIRRQQSAVDEREAWRAERAALAESVRQQTSDERAEEARRVAYEERASQADAVRREAAQWARAKAEAHGEYARSAVDLATASREASFFSREVALDAAWRRNSALGERGRAERTRRAAMDAVQMQRQHEAKQAMAATVRASKLVSSGNVSMADTAHRLRSAASCSSLGAFSDHHNDHPREEDLFDEALAYPHPHPAIDAAVAARYREARPASAPPQRSRPPPPRSPGAASLSRAASNASLSPSRTSSPYAARAAGGFGRSPSGGGAMSPGTRPPPSLNSAASVPRFYTDEGLPYYTGGGGGSPPLSARGSPPRAARWRSSSAPPRPVQSITAHLAARLQQADSDADDSSPPPLRDRFTPDSPRWFRHRSRCQDAAPLAPVCPPPHPTHTHPTPGFGRPLAARSQGLGPARHCGARPPLFPPTPLPLPSSLPHCHPTHPRHPLSSPQ